MNFNEIRNNIQPVDMEYCRLAQEKWDNIAKPLRSLGELEKIIVRLAGIQKKLVPVIDKKAVVIFCSDNGVVAEGVSQCGSEVTASVAESFAKGTATVNAFAKKCGADVFPVDVGIAKDINCKGIIDRKIAYGTQNIASGRAMSEKQCIKAVMTGIEIVNNLHRQGYNMIMTGEMGIGNTTTSSAVISVLENVPPESVTGKGAGLSDNALIHKTDVIRRAIEVNKPDRNNITDVMSKLGGFDICAMAGCFIGGALYRIPVIIDGFISAVAADCAIKAVPECSDYIFASHCSAEPAGKSALDAVGKISLINCGMRLGEGTGAVIGAELFDYALAAYSEPADFDDISVEKYQFL